MASEPEPNLRGLIWIYFLLLIFEGTLRKWVLPQLANPLLIIRDPVVFAAIAYSIHRRQFPFNPYLMAFAALALLSVIAGLLAEDSVPFVTAFGFRTNFLHLPLIFLMGSVLDSDDVQKFGRWVLFLAIPIGILMVLQFKAPANSWLNTGAGIDSGQIASAMGKVRPAGTFSYNLGPIFFFAVAAAFLFQSQISPGYFPRWLVAAAGVSLIAAATVSGSRSFLIYVGFVCSSGILAILLFRPTVGGRVLKMAFMALLIVVLASSFKFFKEGYQVFSVRIDMASAAEGGSSGLLDRALRDYRSPFSHVMEIPAFGYGLGMGTNAGAAILTGKRQFLLAEGEWDRALMESGPYLGGLFILMRVLLAVWLGICALRAAAHAYFLPILLLSACLMPLINGGWGQPTTLGFATFVAGLCAASMRFESTRMAPAEPAPVARRVLKHAHA